MVIRIAITIATIRTIITSIRQSLNVCVCVVHVFSCEGGKYED
jgi:hypothetical protein